MQGWIKIHRKLSEWEWYTDSQAVHLFVHFLINANHADGKWKGNLVKRGQFISGLYELSKQTGISEQSIRTNIKRLKSTGELTSQSTNKFTLYTIVNYEKFQGSDVDSTDQLTSKLTNEQQATNKPLTTNKNEKNNNNEKKEVIISLRFDEFWHEYPKNGASKAKAKQFYEKAIKQGVEENEIIRRAREYNGYCQNTDTKIAHATTWLNQERWTIDYRELYRAEKYQGGGNNNSGFIGQMERTAELARQRIADRG